jgi:multiple sugar transport system permease protein
MSIASPLFVYLWSRGERVAAARMFRRPWDKWGLIFLLPGLLFFAAIFIYPTVRTLFISFTDYNLFTPPKFTGIDNYATLFRQGVFLDSAKVTGIYVLVIGVLNYVLPFAIALGLASARRGQNLGRALYFLPVILPWVVVGTIWRNFYTAPGPIGSLLGLVGISFPLNPLNQPPTALAGLIVIALWKSFGFYVVLFMTGLYAIPEAYYEVADIDGASTVQRFRWVTFPLMRSTSLFIATVNFIGAIKEFDPFSVITGGGPAKATYAVTLFIYDTGFKFLRMGRAAAASLLLCAALVAVTAVQFRIFRPARD